MVKQEKDKQITVCKTQQRKLETMVISGAQEGY